MERLVTIAFAAETLCLTKRSIYRLIEEGALIGCKLSPAQSSSVRVSGESLDRLMEEGFERYRARFEERKEDVAVEKETKDE